MKMSSSRSSNSKPGSRRLVGFFLTLIGAELALRDLRTGGRRSTLLLVAGFAWLGLRLWPA